MSPDKILNKIQLQIKDIAPNLEVFIEHTIQPTAAECEKLEQHLKQLQESLVIYRFLRENKELSPSFNIHAKISEKEIPPVKPAETAPVEEIHETPPIKTELKEAIVESIKTEAPLPGRHIIVGINDKFRFINELFAQNASEYGIALEQLNTLKNWHDAEVYLNSLKSLYGWKETSDITKHFYVLVKKRFE
jgi:hypothetical protein